MTTVNRMREHLPEYLIEAWGLGTFMVSASVFSVLLATPLLDLPGGLDEPISRRALIGIAMGLTAILIIRSPWGVRSGAHLNPAVTLTYLQLGRVHPVDALGYVAGQSIGGILGVLCAWFMLGDLLSEPPVAFAMTRPGDAGVAVAFGAELAISFVLMSCVLVLSNSSRFSAATPFVAGALVALYITVEAPLSGMSMNPARSLASALPAAEFRDLWIYLLAPPLGMGLAARWFSHRRGTAHCAKLLHGATQRCIHCGYEPPANAGQEMRDD